MGVRARAARRRAAGAASTGDEGGALDRYDAVVIGSGPNGLVAAAALARAGWSVLVLERGDRPGGAVRTDEATLPGYHHDLYSAFYGLLHASPVFAELGLDRRVEWASFDTPVASTPAPGQAALLHADPARTAGGLGRADGRSWLDLVAWWERAGRRFLEAMLAPLPAAGPLARFARAVGPWGGARAATLLVSPMARAARGRFEGEPARTLLASGASHTDLGIDRAGSVPPALILAMVAQTVGMPVPVGGAGRLAEALTEVVLEAGGEIRTRADVVRVDVRDGRAQGVGVAGGGEVGARRAVLADTSPGALVHHLVGAEHFPRAFLAGLRGFRHGSGVFKVDLALRGPAPWAAEGLDRTGVVHLTGDLEAMAASAREVRAGLLPARPLAIVGQQTVADATRAPGGCHTLWVEMHVPPAPRGDAAGRIRAASWEHARAPFLERVLDLLEEHAPGLRGLIAGIAVRTPDDLERENPNLVGGDLGGGSSAISNQLFLRPVPGWSRYALPVRGLYLCSASAHPGGGVHGMVGRNCADRVLADARRRPVPVDRG